MSGPDPAAKAGATRPTFVGPAAELVELSAVVPLYRSVSTIADLHRRLAAAIGGLTDRYEIVFVDDGCPEGSGDVARALAGGDAHVGLLRMGANHGQHAAVLAGLRRARGRWVAVLDADLQDAPEDIPALLRVARAGFDAVFAGRRGRYESRLRLLTSKIFKCLLHVACGSPADAGLFVILSRRAVDRLSTFRGRGPVVQVLIARTGLPCTSVPVVRQPSLEGRSAYNTGRRLRLAAQALRLAVVGERGAREAVVPVVDPEYVPPGASLPPAVSETP